MDLATQTAADTGILHVKDANGIHMFAEGNRDKPSRIHLYGPGSTQAQTVDARQSARSLKRYRDNDGKISLPSPEEAKAEAAEDLATMTAKFENLSYSPAGDAQGFELFRAVYADPKLGYIAKQVDKFAADWANFTKGSGAS